MTIQASLHTLLSDCERRGDLVENLGLFCGFLREHGITVGLGQEIDAASALLHVDLLDPEDFRLALKAILLVSHNDERTFDGLFWDFWLNRPVKHLEQDINLINKPSIAHGLPTRKTLGVGTDEGSKGERGENKNPPWAEEIPSYSPEEVLRKKSFEEFTELDLAEMTRLLKTMVFKLATRPSRRKRPSTRRQQVDLRRSFRHTWRYGGEFVELAYMKRRMELPKIIALCDTSGSMDPYSEFFIRFLFSLKQTVRQIEILVFSTSLTRLTPLFTHGGITEVLREMSTIAPDWSGGTQIGASLMEFLRTYAGPMLGNDSIVVIVSDGLEGQDLDDLEHAMCGIRKKARKVIWLNPLSSSPDYEPLCRGMTVALPFVDHFASCHNLESLERVIQHLRI